jgi:hypothetical protein
MSATEIRDGFLASPKGFKDAPSYDEWCAPLGLNTTANLGLISSPLV